MEECCGAILDFQDGHFVFCELEDGHEGPHKALNFGWYGKKITKAHASDRLRGMNLMKMKLKKTLKNNKT